MSQNTRHFQKGMIDWKWIVAVSALVAAFIVYYRSGVRIVNPGPSAPVLIEPAAGALVDVDDSVTRFVWRHTESDAAKRSNMTFVVCVLDAGEECSFPSPLAEPAFRRWNMNATDLSGSAVGGSGSIRQYAFDIPDSESIPLDSNGSARRWSVVACWPVVVGKCTVATPADFSITGPNLQAASPGSNPLPNIGALAISVRAHNTSSRNSGPFDFVFRFAHVVVDDFGQRILDITATEVQPNPRYISRNGDVFAATSTVAPNTVRGILVPGTDISAPITGTADIPSTVNGNPVAIGGQNVPVTVPAGVAIFLWIDPDNDRIESDENDNFRSGLETSL